MPTQRWIRLSDLHREPFRLFFPAATLAGMVGVALWPIMLLGWTDAYAGPAHARLMVQGFFAGFIYGFLGTALPRMLGSPTLGAAETLWMLGLFVSHVIAAAAGRPAVADGLFLVGTACWLERAGRGWRARQDLPPPSFVLVGLGFGCALAGTALLWVEAIWGFGQALVPFAKALAYHAFVLLCIMGAGGFLLPRFLGLGLRRSFPETRNPGPAWWSSVRVAAAAGAALVAGFVLEAVGQPLLGAVLRVVSILTYLAYEMPVEKVRVRGRGVEWQLVVGWVCIPAGAIAAGAASELRTALIHIELIGGFTLITTAVATQVVFGHSGAREALNRFHPRLTLAAVCMLAGTVLRIAAEFDPGAQVERYVAAAACWLLGAALWAITTLPRVARPDPEP